MSAMARALLSRDCTEIGATDGGDAPLPEHVIRRRFFRTHGTAPGIRRSTSGVTVPESSRKPLPLNP